MKEKIKVAIIAKSNKRRRNGDFGCCVAAVTIDGMWIRLVADVEGDSLPDSIGFKCYGVIVAEIEYAPLEHQPENAVLHSFSILPSENFNEYFNNLNDEVQEFGIFGNFRNSLNEFEIENLNSSFRICLVENLLIYWTSSCKCSFTYQDVQFTDIAMTDPNMYTKKGSEPSEIGKAYIVVSLPNNGPVYNKFVAAIYKLKS